MLMRSQNTWYVPQTASPPSIASAVETVAQSSAIGGRLKALIICCHGSPGYIGIGTGISQSDASAFARPGLRGRIQQLWIRACLVARVQTADGSGTSAPGLRPFVTGAVDGGDLCQALADALQCEVVASTELQAASPESTGTTSRFGIPELPFGMMDEWDGLVARFRPRVAPRFERFPSLWLPNPSDVTQADIFPGR
ncbi:hypothetical protein [Mesorhizobium sp. IMUNJ 23232]|uniref:hypothetical protein n=1 Tax=Mesorhizobium sp. IMUNJ 23232 TaxID=3376064 RepID=UPI0037924731